MLFTARNVPYEDDSFAAATIGDALTAIAGWANDHPGIQVCTTTQRNAYAGADLWVGKTIFNTTTAQQEMWDGAEWEPSDNTRRFTASADLIQGTGLRTGARLGASGIGRHVLHLNPTTNLLEWVEPSDNLLYNPTFLRALDGWYSGSANGPPDPSWQAINDWPNYGNIAGVDLSDYVQNATAGAVSLNSAPIPFPAGAGKALTISFAGLAQTGGGNVQAQIFAYTDTAGTVGAALVAYAQITGWGEAWATGSTPAGTQSLRVALVGNPGTSGESIFSRIKLEGGSVPTPFVDSVAPGPWTSYTTTPGGTGWTFGTATLDFSYRRLDAKTICVRGSHLIGGSDTIGSGALTWTLPPNVTAKRGMMAPLRWFRVGSGDQIGDVVVTPAGSVLAPGIPPLGGAATTPLQTPSSGAVTPPTAGDLLQFSTPPFEIS